MSGCRVTRFIPLHASYEHDFVWIPGCEATTCPALNPAPPPPPLPGKVRLSFPRFKVMLHGSSMPNSWLGHGVNHLSRTHSMTSVRAHILILIQMPSTFDLPCCTSEVHHHCRHKHKCCNTSWLEKMLLRTVLGSYTAFFELSA